MTAIEERDGVRFYVEPTSAFEPVKLIRTPGLGRDRMPAGHPPPPPRGPAEFAEAPRARSRHSRGEGRAAPAHHQGGRCGSIAWLSQPAIGPPIGVEPRKTTE